MVVIVNGQFPATMPVMDKTLAAVVSQRLAAAMERRGLNQNQLSKELDMTRQGVFRLKSGTALPSVEVLVRLADVLGTSTDYLLGRSRRP